MADEFVRANGEDPRENPISTQILMLTAEETKKVLSTRKQAHYVVNHAGKSLAAEITREKFDELTQDLLYRSENRLGRVIKQANLSWDQIGQVLAVGGSTRMPQVADMLRRVTGKEPNISLSPDEAIAQGAAIHAAVCAARPLPLPPLPKGAAIAARQPEAQAQEQLQAGVIGFFKKRVLDLLRSIRTTNVNAHSLGVIVLNHQKRKRVSVLVPHNTQLPFGVKRRFGTVRDNQTTVTVRVVEGESPEPDDCLPVGACSIYQLPPGLPKGSPVEVTFTYDNSGRLHVAAVEVTSGKWASVSIERSTGSTREAEQIMAVQRAGAARVS
jgi:molecular chaperone DnaK